MVELEARDTVQELALTTSGSDVEKQRGDFARDREAKSTERKRLPSACKESRSKDLPLNDEQIAYNSDIKVKLSTRILEESLAQHGEIEFNLILEAA